MSQLFLDFHEYERVLLKAHNQLISRYKCLEIDYEKLNETYMKLWRKVRSDSLMIEAKDEIDQLSDQLERLRSENEEISLMYKDLVVDLREFHKIAEAEWTKAKNDERNRVN